MKKTSEESRDIKDLTPVLQLAFPELKRRYEKLYPELQVKLICTYRPPERQKELYAQGRTVPGNIVTQNDGIKKLSEHNHYPARAFDVGVFYGKTYLTDDKYYMPLGDLCYGLCLIWGGAWKTFKDYPHFQEAE